MVLKLLNSKIDQFDPSCGCFVLGIEVLLIGVGKPERNIVEVFLDNIVYAA